MDTSPPPAEDVDCDAPGRHTALASQVLAAEIRHSAYLIGGALGFIGSFAMLLLFLTTRFGG